MIDCFEGTASDATKLTQTRQRCWDFRCAALLDCDKTTRYAAAQEVKVQELEKKRCGVRDTSQVCPEPFYFFLA